MLCPCKDCDFRHEACWASCEVYKDYRKHYDGMRDEKLKTRLAREFLNDSYTRQARKYRIK